MDGGDPWAVVPGLVPPTSLSIKSWLQGGKLLGVELKVWKE